MSISCEEAFRIIEDATQVLPSEKCPFEELVGRILREPVNADRDLPPFDRVMMDGIAISQSAWDEGIREFPIDGLQAAGALVQQLKDKHHCLEVMTGAVLPMGSDCVLPYEEVEIDAGKAKVNGETAVKAGLNIHQQGSDFSDGSTLVEEGTRLTSREIAVAASCGKDSLSVTVKPRVAIIDSGDELVEVNEAVERHQIRRSNIYALNAALTTLGVPNAEMIHLIDERENIEIALRDVVERTDVVILSGGVSKGKRDFIPEVLDSVGVEKAFHGVKQRPGKPFWYGNITAGPTIFALPGNPLSTLVCFHRYVKPALDIMFGLSNSGTDWISLSQSFTFKPALTYFLPVRVDRRQEGLLSAIPVPGSNSGDYASVVPTQGFVELPAEERSEFKEGYNARYFPWI